MQDKSMENNMPKTSSNCAANLVQYWLVTDAWTDRHRPIANITLNVSVRVNIVCTIFLQYGNNIVLLRGG